MTIFDEEMNLPGVITQVEADYSYGYDTSLWGTTESVAVIGTAFNGPVGVPTPIYSPEHASYVFGKVYDATTRLEASLVAGIQDAWARGCRTIYGVRVGGKDLYKDFDLRVESPYRLRVSSMFPTNKGKECYIRYNNSPGEEEITFYKPAQLATIAEKKRGLVTGANTVMKTSLKLAKDYGMSADDRLIDLINTFNNHPYNNVIKLSVVDTDGIDVTNKPEVYNITLGTLYPGVYFIGRDATNPGCTILTQNQFTLVNDLGTNKPFASYDGQYFRTLKFNTDVAQPIPIYARTVKEMRDALIGGGVTVAKAWDFLETAELTNRVFLLNDEDYEETQLSNFEIYKRLGMGYATTAHAIQRKNGAGVELTPRVKESDPADKNHVLPISDGIYSILQDAEIKYRALVCVNADDDIDGKLPRADEFKISVANDAQMLMVNDAGMGYITITPKVASKDFTKAKKYSIEIKTDVFNDPDTGESILPKKDEIYTGHIFPVISEIPDDLEDEFKNKVLNKKHINEFAQGELLLSNVQVPAETETLFYPSQKEADGITDKLDSEGLPIPNTTVTGVTAAVKEANVGTYNNYTVPVTTVKTPAYDSIGLYRRTGDDLEIVSKTTPGEGYIVNRADGSGADLFIANASGILEKVSEPSDMGSKKYILGESIEQLFVYDKNCENIGDLKTILSDADGKIVISASNTPYGLNKIIVKSNMFDTITLEELIDDLNNDIIFGRLFYLELTEEGMLEKDSFILDKDIDGNDVSMLKDNASVTIDEDRYTTYDYNLYVPYRTTDNFARQLAQHCTYTELKTAPTFGFIGCSRLNNTGLAAIADSVDNIVAKDFDLYAKNNYGRNMLDASALPYPIGKNISLIFAQYPVTITSSSYTYVSNGAAGYAAMISTLPLDQSSTGQPIALTDIDFALSQSQLVKLTNAGLVTIRRSFTKGFVVTDGITMAPAESVYRRLSSSRIVGACEELIRAACEPFIGKENHTANRNALSTAISSNMDKIVGTLIEAYDFTMNTDPKILKFNYIEIDYQIVPIYEIREIRNTLKITDQLSTASTTASE